MLGMLRTSGIFVLPSGLMVTKNKENETEKSTSLAICHHLFCHFILNSNLRKMVIVAYILLGFLIFVYVSALFSVWKQRKADRTEWEDYWDEVMKRNSKQ